MNLKVAQVIGLNTDQKAAQVISSSREGESFFAVLDLSCDDAFTKGRQILSDISDFYFDFEGTPGEKLNATFEGAGEKFETQDFSILLASVSGKVLYLINKGDMEVYLKRGEKLSSLLSVGSASQLISGFLQAGDKLLLSTKSLVNFLGEDLEKALNLEPETFEQDLTDRIGASNLENQGLAGLAVEVMEEQVGEYLEEKKEIPALEQESYAPEANRFKAFVSTTLGLLKSLPRLFPKSGRVRAAIAIFLIIVIALGVGLKIKSGRDAQRNAAFTKVFNQARDDFSAARNLSSLNPVDARSKLDSAKNNLNQALSLKPKDTDAQNLKTQIDQEEGSILQQSSASEFPVFLDLGLIKESFHAKYMSLSAGKLLLLDPDSKSLVVVDMDKKSNQILAGKDQLGDGKLASLNGELAFVYSEDKGVLKIDSTNKKVTTVSKVDKDWGAILDIAGFGGNIYLLDSAQVWKYLPTPDGYSTSREYLSKDTKADFVGALRMQIESSIYVLRAGGEIIRFTRGVKDNFGLEGLEKGVKDPKSIFTSSDTDDFYVLDSGNSRLLRITKTGKFKGEISGEKFGVATDLVVDEKGKKVYLLEGSKIFQVDLK